MNRPTVAGPVAQLENQVPHAVCRPLQQSAPCPQPAKDAKGSGQAAPGTQILTVFLSVTPSSSLGWGWVPLPPGYFLHCRTEQFAEDIISGPRRQPEVVSSHSEQHLRAPVQAPTVSRCRSFKEGGRELPSGAWGLTGM